jgi:Flp pilus assembly protein TadD
LRPRFRQAEINRANVLFALGQPEAALAAASEILSEEPSHAQALCIRGAALQRLGRLDEALVSLDAALQARPAYPEALLNRGNVLQELGRLEDALTSYESALVLRPLYPEVLSSRGVALKELGRLEEAGAAFEAALKLKPGYPDARNNLSGALLLRGDLVKGFKAFESRWERSNAPRKTICSSLPTWNGEEAKGRRILVWDEQGLGDLIQFCRYLPLLIDRGADATLLGRKSMFRLLGTLPATPRFVEAVERQEHYDCQIALMSLPHAFGTSLETVPAAAPYLHAEPLRVAEWAGRIGREGFRIGICRQGNPTINLQRTVPLACFAELAAIEGVRLISLAKESTTEEADPGFRVESLGTDFDAGPDSFLDAAAVMANCDLIVTSDTSLAHLAGALGRPVFLALKYVPDWRWLAAGEHSPWYPRCGSFGKLSAANGVRFLPRSPLRSVHASAFRMADGIR